MPSFLNQIFGSRPQLPTLPRTDLGQEQGRAISANQAAMPGAQALASQANQFSREQIGQMLQSVIPNYNAMTTTASTNIESMLKGEIPQDVSTAVQNSAAARALGGGFGGSSMARNLVARDLGLTSLDLTQRGLSSAQSWMQTMNNIYSPGMMNLTSMFVTPQQMYATENEQNLQQFQRDWMGSQLAAMPDPVLSGINAEIMTLASSFLGGMGKGGGGGGGGMAKNYTQDYSDMPGVESTGGGFGGDGFNTGFSDWGNSLGGTSWWG